MKVRVVRPLCIAGQRKEVGEIVDLPTVDALGAIHIGRAERVGAEPPPPGPMTMKTVEPSAEPLAESPVVESAATPVGAVKKRKGAQEQVK